MNRVRHLSNWAWLNVAGLALAAAGMLVQIAAGSQLYPSLTGPIVLIATATLVAFGPARWTPYVGLGVPLVLGIGAMVAAVMNGAFVVQLTTFSSPTLVLGSVMHVIGLLAAVAGGIGCVLERRGLVSVER